jgi:DNA-directed RNA polymerase specialized sigma24 family protein
MENPDLLMEPERKNDQKIEIKRMIESCFFSKFEQKVLELRLQDYKIVEIAKTLNCKVKQVYDANDRIKRKLKGVKNSLDINRDFC